MAFASLCIVSSCLQYTHDDSCLIWYYILPLNMWCGLCISLHCFQLFTIHTQWLVFNMLLYTTIEYVVWPLHLSALFPAIYNTHTMTGIIWYYILPLNMWCGLCISLHCFQLFSIHTQWLVFNMLLYTTIEYVVWHLHLSALLPAIYNTHTMTRV